MEEAKLTCENLVDALAALPRTNTYSYINKATHTALKSNGGHSALLLEIHNKYSVV